MNRQIFREYDIRGVVETDLTPEVVRDIGRAFGSRVIRAGGKNVAVGRDVRLSGDELFASLSDGIRSTGCNVTNIGEVPTPLLYFSQFHLDMHGAIMITGSHNPPEFNGFKLLIDKKSVHGREIQELADEIEKGEFAEGDGELNEANVIEPYMTMIKEKINLSRPIKIVIDSGNGCGGLVAPQLFRDLGCEVIELFSEPDGTFPNHHPDPTVEKNNEFLKKAVLENGAEVGFGYDGDADRLGVIDNEGNQLHGDQALMIFAREILSRRKGAKVIFDVKCTRNLPEDIKKHGGVPIMSATGHSIIKKRLADENAALAGEMSAHIFFADGYYGYDDALYATARFLEIMDGTEKPVSSFLEDVPKTYSTPEIRLDCPDDVKFEIVNDVVSYFRERYEVIDIDGVRIEFSNGWGLIRASNTQPVLVMRFEAESAEQLEAYKKEVREKLVTYEPLKTMQAF